MIRKSLLLLAACFATPAYADWQEAKSEHFTVYADDRPEQVKAFTERLERFDRAMKVIWNIEPKPAASNSRVTVFQVATVGDIERLSRRGVGGFYSPRASGAVAFVPRTAGNGAFWQAKSSRLLYHEYSHHFMFAYWPQASLPPWYVEGFAEYHSTAIFKNDGSVIFGAPPIDRGGGAEEGMGINDDVAMPVRRMLNPHLGQLDGRSSYALYSRGWLLTHYLLQSPERLKAFGQYISDLEAGKPYLEAARHFGDLNSLNSALNRYVRADFQSNYVAADKIRIGAVTVRALSPGEAATMPTRIESTAGVDRNEALKVVAAARTAAAPFPNDAAAQNVLAEAEYDARNYAAAVAAADRAIAADPKSVHALVYKGLALQAIARQEKTRDPARWREVRRWFIAANRADTEHAWPLILNYGSYRAAGETPTANAENGLIYAIALAPYDFGSRLDAARIYLKRNDIPAARQEIRRVAFRPHAGEAGEKLRAVLDALDASGAPAALALLDQQRKEAVAKAREKRGADGDATGDDDLEDGDI